MLHCYRERLCRTVHLAEPALEHRFEAAPLWTAAA